MENNSNVNVIKDRKDESKNVEMMHRNEGLVGFCSERTKAELCFCFGLGFVCAFDPLLNF